jgi:cytoskeletal protein RodZ
MIMRRKSFAIVAMLVIAAALMSSVIPSGSINVAFAENDYSQNRSSEEDRHSEDESNFEEEEEEEDDSTRSNDEDDDNEEDSEDNVRSQDEDENSEDEENGDNGDSSETGTEQENEQKNVCSGWAVCINVAENAKDTTTTGADSAGTESEIPFQLATPF